MFTDAILRAKTLMLKELKSSQSRNVIYQTMSFFPAHAYAEMVDGICWLFYYCIYFNTLSRNGYRLGGLSPGKLKAMTNGLLIPTRIFDLLAAALAPIIIHENVFIPSPYDVRCVNRGLDETHTAFGVLVGSLTELYERYAVTLRSGYIAYLNSQPGESILLDLFDEENIQPAMRMIAFLPVPLDDEPAEIQEVEKKKVEKKEGEATEEEAVAEEIRPPEIAIEAGALPLLPENKTVEFAFLEPEDAAEAPRGPQEIAAHVASFDAVLRDYEPRSDLSEVDCRDFFIPYPYSHLDESDVSYQAAAHLAVTMYTNYDMRHGDPSRLIHALDVNDFPGYLDPLCFGMTTRVYNSYTTMYSLRTLKAREAWQLPRIHDFANLEDTIVHSLMQAWDNYHFPSLCITEQVPIPSLGVKQDSPFFPSYVRWNRKVRDAIKPSISLTVTKNTREETYRKKPDARAKSDIKEAPPDVTTAEVT